MKLLIVSLVITVGVLGASGFSSRPAEAVPTSPPLLSCPDFNGSGNVDLFGDIFNVAFRFGADYGDPDYYLLYDFVQTGQPTIDLFNDIFAVALAFGDQCGLFDSQIGAATTAIEPYKDPVVAMNAGYVQSTQYVSNMGIHMYNLANQIVYPRMDDAVCDTRDPTYDPVNGPCQLEHPAGLVYTNGAALPSDPHIPGELIGAWYIVPNPEVCAVFGHPNPSSCQDSGTEPVGFGLTNTDEDNQDVAPTNKGWHDHTGLCGGNFGTTSAVVLETGNTTLDTDCINGSLFPCGLSGCFWFDQYAWMMHLYNVIPNPAGRFAQWNYVNLP